MRMVNKAIEDMQLMTQECFTACLECGEEPVGEHRKEKLEKFAIEHPECVQYQKELLQPRGIPDWKLVEPPKCFIMMVCCRCCEDNHKGVWEMCQQARKDYEEERKEGI